MSLRILFAIAALLHVAVLIYFFFLSYIKAQNCKADASIALHSRDVIDFLRVCGKDIQNEIELLCSKASKQIDIDTQIEQRNKLNSKFQLYKFGKEYELNDDNNIKLNLPNQEISVGKIIIKTDATSSKTQEVLPIIIKTKDSCGDIATTLVIHVSLEYFRERMQKLIMQNTDLKFAVLDENNNIVFNFNLNTRANASASKKKNHSIGFKMPFTLIFTKQKSVTIPGQSVNTYYVYQSTINIFQDNFARLCAFTILLLQVVIFSLYIIIKANLATITRCVNYEVYKKLRIIEFASICSQVFSKLQDLKKYKAQSQKLIKKNAMLHDIAQSYLNSSKEQKK